MAELPLHRFVALLASARFLPLLAISACVLAGSGEEPDDALAWERHLNTPDDPVAAVDWFTPTTSIGDGEGGSLRQAMDDERTVSAAALAHALDYARSMNSYGLIVAHRGLIQLEHYPEGFGPQRLLDSQSLHKPLAAILTMAAVADGHLALDDPLARFIPEWQSDPRGKITVRDVLYMQTGLAQPPYEADWDSPGYQLFITSRLREAVLAMPAEAPAGTHYRSHYAATQLLQLVLESAIGRPYADYLNTRLWQPLEAGAARVRLDRSGGNAQVFCCLQARPRDWLRIGLMLSQHGLYNGETVLPFDTFMELTTPSPLAPNFAMQQVWRGSPYAPVRSSDSRHPERGLRMSAPFLSDDVFYLEGRGGQRVYVVPSHELVVVRQGEIRSDWDDAAFLNGILEGVPDAGAFSALLAPPAPDYSIASSWARQPDGQGREERAAAFYLQPTTYSGELWNPPHSAPDINPGVDDVVLGQATVLDACCEVWAPRYRQASFAALREAPQAFDLAFLDVRAAFEHFLAAIGDRPFVILGHSQGALHTQNLVRSVVDRDPALAERLIAAYVVGIPVPEAFYETTLKRVSACETPRQLGCIASWASFAEGFPGVAQWREIARTRYADIIRQAGSDAIQCTNPLSWRADDRPAPPESNLGATMINDTRDALVEPVPSLFGARCDQGALLVSPEPPAPFSALVYSPGSYHFLDVALFHENIQRNLSDRAAAWYGR